MNRHVEVMSRLYGVTGLIVMLVWLVAASTDAVAKGYETPPVLAAKDVLPPFLIRGEHFQVLDGVENIESVNLFKVKTDSGTMDVYGEPMLRIRLREIEAIHQLKNTSAGKVAGEAAIDTATKSVKSLGTAIAHPVQTAKALPGGVARMFMGVARDVGEVVDIGRDVKEDYEEGGVDEVTDSALPKGATHLAGKYTGVNKEYREWAELVGVDPYTTNQLLYEELRRVAMVDAAVSLGTGLVLPVLPGTIGLIADLSTMAYKQDWREIFSTNRKAMKAMGVSPEVIDRFERSEAMTPSMMALIVLTLENMEGVQDRKIVIEQASLLETEEQADFFSEGLLMAKWYHKNKVKLKKMLFETLIPVGETVDGRVVAFSAADHAYWDKLNASLASEFTQHYVKYSDKREVWVADNASPKFVEGMNGLGWTVHTNLRSKGLPRVPWGLPDPQ